MARSLADDVRGLVAWRGRATRRQYWIALGIATVSWAVMIGGLMVSFVTMRSVGVAAAALVLLGLPGALLMGSVTYRRLRDRNRPPLLLILFIVGPQQLLSLSGHLRGGSGATPAGIAVAVLASAIWIWSFVEVGFLRGTVGSNRYGPDPLGPPSADVFS